MACNKASVLLILALVFIVSSGGAGVEAWCIKIRPNPGPSPYVCNVPDGPEVCATQCKEVGYDKGGLCDGIDGCLCLKCAN